MKLSKCLIFLGVLFFASLAYAGIVVQPDSTEVMVKADEAATGILQVVNSGQEAVHVKVQPEDWLKQRTGASSVPVEAWLTVEPIEFDMNPGETKSVDYTINVPRDASAEVVAMVYFATTALQGTLNITNRYGVSIYAAVSDKINIDCELKGLDIDSTNDKGIIFILNLVNKGNAHLRPTGNILITSADGTKSDLRIGRDFPIYSGLGLEQRVFWKNGGAVPGKYEAEIMLDYGNLYKLDKKLTKKISFTIDSQGDVSF
ncbi:MAG: hypothetical protein PHS46_01210 [Candidatus Omnitrophica bacterium]|nr:hypothetical protein [Candidatus Omnitrophota bacterium]